jgi:hypothetical protein
MLDSVLPLAHVAHWTWVLYILPLLVVVVSVLRTVLTEKREGKGDPPAGGAGVGSPRG